MDMYLSVFDESKKRNRMLLALKLSLSQNEYIRRVLVNRYLGKETQ